MPNRGPARATAHLSSGCQPLERQTLSAVRPLQSPDELKAYLTELFGQPLTFVDAEGASVMFVVDGKVKPLMLALQEKTGKAGWTGEAVHYSYSDKARDVHFGISSVPGSVLCNAYISSRHAAHLRSMGVL